MGYVQGEGRTQGTLFPVTLEELIPDDHVCRVIGRAFAMQGDTAKARVGYQDFLTLWKDADPDIPILKQAKAEYAKLQ